VLRRWIEMLSGAVPAARFVAAAPSPSSALTIEQIRGSCLPQ